MAKKLLLFDFDGTIADTLPTLIEIVNEHTAEYGIKKITKSHMEKLRGMTIKELLGEFKVSLFKLPFILGKIRSELLNRMNEVTILPGMKEMVDRLYEKGYPIAIFTSNSKENVTKFLRKRHFSNFHTIYSNKNIFGKAMTFRSIMYKRGITPRDIIYIGDEVRDVEASKEVGIPIVAVTWGFNNETLLAKHHPDVLVSTPEELLKAIEDLS